MTCEESSVLLSAKLDDMLTEEEGEALARHLEGCPACRALAEELESLCLSFDELEELEAPAGLAAKVMEQLRAGERHNKVVPLFRHPRFKALSGLAACTLLCVGLWQGGFLTHERRPPMDDQPQAMGIAELDESTLVKFSQRNTRMAPPEGEVVTMEEDYGRLSLTIPEGWTYRTIRNEGSFGIAFGPEGEAGQITLTCSERPVGVCGTGLVTEDLDLDLDRVVQISTYDHHDLWDFMDLGEEPGTIMAWTQEGVDRWWDTQGDTAMAILRAAELVKT